MQRAVTLVLVIILLAQGAYANGPNDAAPKDNVDIVFKGNGTNDKGLPFESKEVYVEGSDSLDAANAALEALENSNGEKQLIVSTDNLENPNLKKLKSRIDKFQRVQKFLFNEAVNSVKEKSRETYQVIKEDPGGIFFFFLTTGLSTSLYIHFVQNPNLFSIGVPVFITALSNALFVKPSLLFPVDNLRNRIKVITKLKEKSIGKKLGIDTGTNSFRDFQDASVGVGGVTGGTMIFENFTRYIPKGWGILTFQVAALRDGIFSGLSNTSFVLAVRRWQRSENPPLTSDGIDWFIRSQRLAMAYFLPHLYAAKDVTGFIGVAAVGAVGWLLFWKGDKIIPTFKEKVRVCSDWLGSLKN
jgi:hypothetical protein